MSSIKTNAKNILLGVLYGSGLLRLRVCLRLRNSAAVLMYHRVLPADRQSDSYSTESIVITPETFDRHMALLKKHFHPLSAQEFEDAAKRGHFPARSCLVTFDDGWFDNVEYALPILRRHEVPAVVFVTTDYIGSDRTFWQETLCRLAIRTWRTGTEGTQFLSLLGCDLPQAIDEREARARAREFVNRMKSVLPNEVRSVLERMREYLTARHITLSDFGEDRFMSWEEVRRLTANGLITIGSHAHSHTPLPALPPEEVLEELNRSAAEIARHLGTAPVVFAYPNGSYDSATSALVREAGYHLAFTTASGTVNPHDDPMCLRRMNIAERGTRTRAEFFARLAGVA